jgi:phosphatidylinositol phospholipase C delta
MISRALSDIAIYCQSRHFPGFTHDGCSPHKIISFSERVSLRLAKQTLQEYTNLNKSHLTRVYPAGFRINSTNYDPHHHWAAGCQVVALNYQSHGEYWFRTPQFVLTPSRIKTHFDHATLSSFK